MRRLRFDNLVKLSGRRSMERLCVVPLDDRIEMVHTARWAPVDYDEHRLDSGELPSRLAFSELYAAVFVEFAK